MATKAVAGDDAEVQLIAPSEEPRKPGLIQGVVGDEFFEPLPDEELAHWEGKARQPPLLVT